MHNVFGFGLGSLAMQMIKQLRLSKHIERSVIIGVESMAIVHAVARKGNDGEVKRCKVVMVLSCREGVKKGEAPATPRPMILKGRRIVASGAFLPGGWPSAARGVK